MGPTKTIVTNNALYEAMSGKLIQGEFVNRRDIEDYVNHHYLALPVVDNQGQPWMLDGKPVYCLRGVQYETLDEQKVQLARCPDCGGMGIRSDELSVETDVIHCTSCGHEFDARLEMMET